MLVAACRDRPSSSADTTATPDTAFQAMDHRHGDAVGADPAALSHEFVAVPAGGDVILVRKSDDDMTTGQIRAHLDSIASSFRRGDFAVPGFVHGKPVSGTDVMQAKRQSITYTVDSLPNGGALRIRSRDAEALKAIHSFIEFQVAEHRTN